MRLAKSKWIIVGLLVIALVAGSCAKPAPTTQAPAPKPAPTATATPAPSPSPAPAPKPTPTPTPTPAPAPAPKPTPAPTTAQPIVWKYAGIWTPGTSAEYFPKLFKEDVEKATGGRLKIELYPSGQLYSGSDLFAAIQKGLVQIADISGGYFSGPFPAAALQELPFIVGSDAELKKWWDGGLKDLLAPEAEKLGIVWLSNVGATPLQIAAKKAVKTSADWKGLKVRVFSPTQSEGVKLLGGTPQFVNFPEVYTALQRGTLDAGAAGAVWLFNAKWYEVAPFINLVAMGIPPIDIWANKELLDKLPKDMKDAVLSAAKHRDELWDFYDKEYDDALKKMKDKGATIVDYTAEQRNEWAKLVGTMWWAEATKVGPLGTKAFEILNKVIPGRVPPKP